MNALDIIILIPVLYYTYKGFSKGLILELASIIALILGIYGALKFSFITEQWLIEKTSTTKYYVPILAFIITFCGIIIVVHIFAKFLQKIISIIALSLPNKIFGAFFGFSKACVILSFVFFIINSFLNKWGISTNKWTNESILYDPLSSIAPIIMPIINNIEWAQQIKF